jgi:hypothetical protein
MLQEGNSDQRLAAIFYLGSTSDSNAVLPLYQVFLYEDGELKEAACSALWNLYSSGVSLKAQGLAPVS